MPANICEPLYEPGNSISATTTAAVTGKRFVAVSAVPPTGWPGLSTDLKNNIKVAHCGAAARALGVSTYDAASGAQVGVHRLPKVVPVTAGGTVTAGQEVESDATGRAITLASGLSNGIALSSATVGNDVFVALR